MTVTPTTTTNHQHGHTWYFGRSCVDLHVDRGYHVRGWAPDFSVAWGHYPSFLEAQAAARTLDRLLAEHERLDDSAWHEAQARYWRWAEAQAVADYHDASAPEARQAGWRAERHERGGR